MLRLALLAVEAVIDFANEFHFVLWVNSTEEFLRVEGEVTAVIETCIVLFIGCAGLELLEPEIVGALHEQVFVQHFNIIIKVECALICDPGILVCEPSRGEFGSLRVPICHPTARNFGSFLRK